MKNEVRFMIKILYNYYEIILLHNYVINVFYLLIINKAAHTRHQTITHTEYYMNITIYIIIL